MNPIKDKIARLEILNYKFNEYTQQAETLTRWHNKLIFYLTNHKKCGRIEGVRQCGRLLHEIDSTYHSLEQEINRVVDKAMKL